MMMEKPKNTIEMEAKKEKKNWCARKSQFEMNT